MLRPRSGGLILFGVSEEVPAQLAATGCEHGRANLGVDDVTISCWVQRYAREWELRQQQHLQPTNKRWRTDQTYLKVKGECTYLYRAVDSTGATMDLFLSPSRDIEALQRLFPQALRQGAPRPRVINMDRAPTYPAAIAGSQRPVRYLDYIIEQDRRPISFSRLGSCCGSAGFTRISLAARRLSVYLTSK